MNLFDILGPVMVGPSSSHTAGAVRIGRISGFLLKEKPIRAEIFLHGSFATTGIGHGTDKAIVAGLLGMNPDDMRIPDSFSLAEETGLLFSFAVCNIKDAHPNTALLKLTGENGNKVEVQAASIGGGRITVHKVNGLEVDFSAEKPTLIVHNIDMPGRIAKVTSLLYEKQVNIATMQLYRSKRGGIAVMVMELDQPIDGNIVKWVEEQDGITKVTYINMEEKHNV